MKAIVLALAAAAACLFGGPASAYMVCLSCVVVPANPYATTTVLPLGGGEYRYTINLGGSATPVQQVTDFYIPYFADMGIVFGGQDFTGTYASYGIEADSIFGLGGEVLHYRFAPSAASYSVNQAIEFDAAFSGAEAPFRSDLVDANGNHTTFMGDPLIPGSPELLEALDAANRVSEPGMAAMFFSGLGLLVVAGMRGGRSSPVHRPALA